MFDSDLVSRRFNLSRHLAVSSPSASLSTATAASSTKSNSLTSLSPLGVPTAHDPTSTPSTSGWMLTTHTPANNVKNPTTTNIIWRGGINPNSSK
jgi:hypothetical protein